ncbi:MAG: hypothetical protein A2017_18385 [Lentisphaerae bacterium GWF2_44_16]|nr:MAG: hypothetical protein A2017_18385 [Lentisphaerae bacterium GWF2_44_16]
MKKQNIYIMMNLFFPGIGQLMLRRWIRGSLQIIGCLAAFIWLIWEVVSPLYINIATLLLDSGVSLVKPDIYRIIISFFICLLIWIWSILDIVIFKTPGN